MEGTPGAAKVAVAHSQTSLRGAVHRQGLGGDAVHQLIRLRIRTFWRGLVGGLVTEVEVVVRKRHVGDRLHAKMLEQLKGVNLLSHGLDAGLGRAVGVEGMAMVFEVFVHCLRHDAARVHQTHVMLCFHGKRALSPSGMGGSDDQVAGLEAFVTHPTMNEMVIGDFFHHAHGMGGVQ